MSAIGNPTSPAASPGGSGGVNSHLRLSTSQLDNILALKTGSIGSFLNAWGSSGSGVIVAASGMSTSLHTSGAPFITAMGQVTSGGATSIYWAFSADNVRFYTQESGKVSLTGPGYFVMHITTGAKYVALTTSNSVRIEATIQAKSG